MKLFLLVSILMIGIGANAQAPFFGHMKKPTNKLTYGVHPNLELSSPTPSTDSIFIGWRPTATAAYGYSNKGGSTLMAFAGISYEKDTYTSSTQTWYANWAVSLQLGTGASNGSVSLANATTLGLFGSFYNKVLTLGIGYNFSNKNAVPLLGPGVAFH